VYDDSVSIVGGEQGLTLETGGGVGTGAIYNRMAQSSSDAPLRDSIRLAYSIDLNGLSENT